MTLTEFILAVYGGLATLIGAAAAAYAAINNSRSQGRVNEAKQKAEDNLSDRNLIMTEYGKLIGEMRGEIVALRDDREELWGQLQEKSTEHERCNQRLTIIEAWAKKHGWTNGSS